MNTPRKRIGLIGYGRFGVTLAEEILAKDFDVLVFDDAVSPGTSPGQNISFSKLEDVLACDTIFYAVPISKFEQALVSHIPYYEKEQKAKTLIDVLSVKLYPKELFEKYLPAHISALLTHPMFGPDSVSVKGLAGQPIVLDQFRVADQQYAFWRQYFADKGLKIIEMSAEEHDRAAANSQGITHFIGRVLDEIDMHSTEIDTVGAKKLLEIKEQTCNDTWELFSGLQNRNPFTIDMRVSLGQAVDTVYSKLLPNRVNQEKLVVGIQGGVGSFNEEAARYYLERSGFADFELQYLYTTAKVLQALHEAKVDRGQFAIHNSTGGIVQETVEAIAAHKFKIVEQFSIKIAHALMVHRDVSIKEVDTIMTHPQVFKQCKRNLEQKYARLKHASGEGELIDHAVVARRIAEGLLPKNIATMGSQVLADLYGLKVIEDNLQDLEHNYTSFLWVERP